MDIVPTSKESIVEDSYCVTNISSHPVVQMLTKHSVGHDIGFIQVSGFIFPALMEKYLDRLKNFEVRDDDVWICTYPKCGTTWAQELVWCLMNNLDFETSKNIDLDDRMIFIEFIAIMKESAAKYYHDTIERAANQTSPRIIKTHLPFTMLPKQIISRERTPKIIHVYRNSRDVCVSMYHHWKLLEGFDGEFHMWSEIFYEGYSAYYSPFWKHVESYYLSNYSNMIFLKYEDMKEDLSSAISLVSSFVGRNYSKESVDQLLGHLSLKNFKATPTLNKTSRTKIAEIIDSSNQTEGSAFIRKGEVGDWINHFSQEMSSKFLEKDKLLFQSIGTAI